MNMKTWKMALLIRQLVETENEKYEKHSQLWVEQRHFGQL